MKQKYNRLNATRAENIVPNEYVEIKWANKTASYYKGLGHQFTGYGEAFFVHIGDLPLGSDAKIVVECPVCGAIRDKEYKLHLRDGHTVCRRCSTVYELSGETFGRLRVMDIDIASLVDGNKRVNWICECECGEVVSVRSDSLIDGKTISCGCYNRERDINHNLTQEDRENSRRYPEYLAWTKSVYKNWNYTCINCGSVGVDLVAHHIRSFAEHPDIRIDPDNGVVLCKTCHTSFHMWLGGWHVPCNELDLNEWLSIEKQREIL